MTLSNIQKIVLNVSKKALRLQCFLAFFIVVAIALYLEELIAVDVRFLGLNGVPH